MQRDYSGVSESSRRCSNKSRESVFIRVQGAAVKRHATEHTISFDLAPVDSCDEGLLSPKKL
jgi:hypothetical protein